MQLANQRYTLDVMDFILTLQEEIKLKLKVATLLWCWWNARNKQIKGKGSIPLKKNAALFCITLAKCRS
jgi:hypothetical protein